MSAPAASTPNLTNLINLLREELQLDPWGMDGNYLNASLLTLMAGIDAVFAGSPTSDFRKQDVEPLLEQANALLDRALADRALFQQAGEKFATFTLDVKRTLETVLIRQAEEADKNYETPYDVSKSDYQAQSSLLDSLNDLIKKRKNALEALSLRGMIESARTGILQEIADTPPTGQASTQVGPFTISGQVGDGQSIVQNYPADTKQQVSRQMAEDSAAFDNQVRLDDMNNQIATLQAQVDSLTESIKGAKAQVDWDDKNQKHLADRAELEETLLKLKMQMATVDYLLDFRQQMKSIGPRFRQTLIDAYTRLMTIEKGMQLVYNRLDPQGLPTKLSSLSDMDDIVAWGRRTGTWLATLMRRSQNYVLPISVKMASEAKLKGSWKSGQSKREWVFTVPQTIFDRQCFVRLRGLAGWAFGSNQNLLWTLNLQLPTNAATWLYEGGKVSTGPQDPIRCRISRVTARSDRAFPDVVGLVACYNATPIGDWTVSVSNALDTNSTDVPDDIQLDLYLSVVLL